MSNAGWLAPILGIEAALFRHATAPGGARLDRAFRQATRGLWMTLYHARHPLSRGRRARAVWNLWAWQAWRRLVREPIVIELQTGTRIVCPTWSKISGAWVSIGVHEPELFFVAGVIRKDDVFLDVGANIGVYALTAARRGATAIAYEPNEDALAVIRQNTELNRVGERITLSRDALADYDGEGSFTVDRECSNQLAMDGARGVPVRVRTLDTSLREHRVTRADFLKIDAEGFDENVLRGAAETLRVRRPTVIVEIWGGGQIVRGLLEAAGYRAFAYDFESRALSELPADYRGDGNLIAVHEARIDEIFERLASAPPQPRREPAIAWRRGSSG